MPHLALAESDVGPTLPAATVLSAAKLIVQAFEALRRMPATVAPKVTALKSRTKLSQKGVTGELLPARPLQLEEAEHRKIVDSLHFIGATDI